MNDNSWKLIGENDPYYGVLTHEAFKSNQLTQSSIDLFYQTGYAHVGHVTNKLKAEFCLPQDHLFETVLDFGCGTGRLIIPFAEKNKKVTGIDISEGMLKEALIQIEKRQITNISLVQIEDFSIHEFPHKYDLVHTYIVLQHINEHQGYEIINKLLSVMSPGGYGIIHLLFDGKRSKTGTLISNLKRKFKWFNQLANFAKGRPLNRPFMQMNYYNLNKVFNLFNKNEILKTVTEFTNHDGYLGVILYCNKKV